MLEGRDRLLIKDSVLIIYMYKIPLWPIFRILQMCFQIKVIFPHDYSGFSNCHCIKAKCPFLQGQSVIGQEKHKNWMDFNSFHVFLQIRYRIETFAVDPVFPSPPQLVSQ